MQHDQPPGRIALSLSGGGFRAAAFHLGTLRCLHRVGILANVRALSTASGGTITGAYYAQCVAEQKSFDEFDSTLRRFLVTHDVIDGALRRVGAPRDSRSATLITAAADELAASLFTRTLGDIAARPSHLEEIAFNATDIERGLPFRFVKAVTRHVHTGNRAYPVSHDLAAQLRLADIVAASSCFPAAFEPMDFPRDFVLPEAAKQGAGVPLMDGGIVDNQAVDSLLLVHSRRRREIDTIIVSDADANLAPMFEAPRVPTALKIRVRTVMTIIAAFGGLCAGAAIALIPFLPSSILGIALLLVSAGGALGVLRAIARLGNIAIAGRARPLLWRQIGTMSVADLLQAAALRGSSLVALTSRIFMKRVRTLTYQRLFAGGDLAKRTIGTLITDLVNDEAMPPWMRELASRAAAMPTTLWSDSAGQIDDVIAVGEMTLCRALLRRIEDAPASADDALRARLNEMWSGFVKRPSSGG